MDYEALYEEVRSKYFSENVTPELSIDQAVRVNFDAHKVALATVVDAAYGSGVADAEVR